MKHCIKCGGDTKTLNDALLCGKCSDTLPAYAHSFEALPASKEYHHHCPKCGGKCNCDITWSRFTPPCDHCRKPMWMTVHAQRL